MLHHMPVEMVQPMTLPKLKRQMKPDVTGLVVATPRTYCLPDALVAPLRDSVSLQEPWQTAATEPAPSRQLAPVMLVVTRLVEVPEGLLLLLHGQHLEPMAHAALMQPPCQTHTLLP